MTFIEKKKKAIILCIATEQDAGFNHEGAYYYIRYNSLVDEGHGVNIYGLFGKTKVK